jgi:N-acetylmuramoyl-L-alanine amidase
MRRRVIVIGACLVLLATGCGRPPEPRVDNVYRGLSENLPRLDAEILKGRRILIDPGHGGYFRGTQGQSGTEEALINLGVSLYLWGLLRETGAEVHLTRSAEKDFLTDEADSTLAKELSYRVALVDSLDPDIFVSIHHNAQSDRDPDKNATETYYRFGDPASRDLAFAVHRHLMRNLGIEDGEVRPGNYYVLRNVDTPAILGEGSYLTHPGVEHKLQLSDKQRLEAEAYFLGILEYFSRGTPRLEVVTPLDTVLTRVPTLSFAVTDIGGIGADPASIDLTVNGRAVTAYPDDRGSTISYTMPWDSPNGRYEVSLGLRNLLGNSSHIRRLHFDLDLEPHSTAFVTEPATLPPAGGAIRVRARLLDRRGLSIADGTTVAIETSSGEAPGSAVVDDGFVEFPLSVPEAPSPLSITLAARGKTFEFELGNVTPGRALRKVVIADVMTNRLVRHAVVFTGDSLVASGSPSGTYFFPGENASDRILASGYVPLDWNDAEALPDTVFMSPWYNGALVGRRIVLDPEGGSGRDPGIGQLGLSGPFVNLQVARYLGEYLHAAGASVVLTRLTEQTLSPRDVVSLTNRFGADRYIEIRHRNAPEDSALGISTFFFPGSRTGLEMARDVQSSAALMLGLEERPPRDLVTFPLQQTACPAIVVEYPSISVLEEELRLGEPWYQRRQAYAVFAGILRHFGVEDTTGLTVQLGGHGSRDNWLVTIDGTWRLLSDPDGQATFVGLERDRMHAVDLRRKGVRRQTWAPQADVPRGDTLWVSVDSLGLPPPAEETP